MSQRLDPQRLRDLRTKAGLSRWDLARAAGVNKRTIEKAEQGAVRIPTPETLRRLAGALGVGVPELLTLRPSPAAADAGPEPSTSAGQREEDTSTTGP